MKNDKSTAIIVVVFVFIIALDACRSLRQASVSDRQSCLPQISSLPDSVYCEPNNDSSYYLCQDKKSLKAHALFPQRENLIVIVKCEDGDLIFNEQVPGGTARWVDNENAEIFCPSGIPRNSLQTTFMFNVKSQKKIYLDSNIK